MGCARKTTTEKQLKASHYVYAFLLSYSLILGAALAQTAWVLVSEVNLARASLFNVEVGGINLLVANLLLAGVNFCVLFWFLRSKLSRRTVAFCLFLFWYRLISWLNTTTYH